MRWCAAVTLLIVCFPVQATARDGITLRQAGDRVEVSLDGKHLTSFHHGTRWDKPFLYPIRTVSGRVLSRGWPVEPRAGEEQDHPWHRGIWYGHGDINGEDFWREKPDRSTSRLVIEGAPRLSESSLEVKLGMLAPKGQRLGSLVQRYTFSRVGKNLLIDTVITIMADAGMALRFGDTEDGGFGFRLAEEFRQDRGARLANSEGGQGTEQIWGKAARWVDYSANIQGAVAGVTVLDHPTNLRHPGRWHARGYGLNAANPFALGDFTGDKKNDGSCTIGAGTELRLRYLVVVHDGDMSQERISRHFSAFAAK